MTLTTPDNSTLVLSNGLITRQFLISPNFGTVDYRSESTGRSLLRYIGTEATITLAGYQYNIGGLNDSSGTHAYLNRSSVQIGADPNAFQYTGHSQSDPTAPFHWEPGIRSSPKTSNWPPKGLHLKVDFKAPASVKIPSHGQVSISLHYELYQGVPIMSKWMSVQYSNATPVAPIKINALNVEYLAVQKPYAPWNYGSSPQPWDLGTGMTGSWLYVETDQAHGTVVQFNSDPAVGASPGASEPLLVCTYYQGGPGVLMANIPSVSSYLTQFDSFKVLELVTDTDDRERVALSRHRMTRLLAPHTQENPIFFHATDNSPTGFQNGINQMVDVGFEMYIYSFGSGFNMESTSSDYIKQIKANIDYAHSKGIEVGG